MGSEHSSAVVVALATVGLCLLSLSLLAAGPGGAAAPLDGNDTNTTLTETVSDTTNSTSDTTEETTDTVTNTTDSVTDTTNSTTDTLSDTTNSTTDTVTNTTEETTEAVTNTTSDSGSLQTTDSGDTLLSTDSTASDDGSEFSDELTDVTGALTDGLTETTSTAVAGVGDTTDTVAGDDGLLTAVGDTLVSGSTLGTTDGATLSDLEDAESTPAGDGSGETGSTPPGAGTASSADVTEPTPAPAGGDGASGMLASLASESISGSIPVTGQTAAGAGLAVGAAAAAGTVLLRGSSFTGTGVGRSTVQMARYGGRSAVRRAGAGVLDRLLRMATFFRYSRYDDSDPLENEARAAVMGAVEAHPGRPVTEVAEAADVNLSTARYHVRVLQKEDLLMRVPVRGRKRLFPAFTQDPELLAALSDEATAPIVDALEELEPASVGDLADELEKSPSTVTHHLQRLEEDGVVVRERDGRSVKNSLAPTTREALAPAAETETKPTATAQSAD